VTRARRRVARVDRFFDHDPVGAGSAYVVARLIFCWTF